jgi:hypothetical protein
MQKKIGIDIDGVITDEGDSESNIWHQALSEYMQRNITRKRDVYDFKRAYDLSSEVIDDFLNERLEKIYSEVSPLQKAKETINYLSENGYKIILITAREQCFRNLTARWLTDHNILYTELYHDDDKAPIAVEKDIDLFIEDNYENATQIVNQNINVLLMDKYHNQDIKKHGLLQRVDNWNDIREYMANSFNLKFPESTSTNKFF